MRPRLLKSDDRDELMKVLFQSSEAGKRCLLDLPVVKTVAVQTGRRLTEDGLLDEHAVAIQAIAFDKNAETNWKVTWHQDLMFPFAQAVISDGYTLPCLKDGVDFAQPPLCVLENLVAVRLHLDDCDESNGPLRVSPGTHRMGIIPSQRVQECVGKSGERNCLAGEGDALLMRPLLLHASSKAINPRHRRVLHLVYYSGPAMTEKWHREVSSSTCD